MYYRITYIQFAREAIIIIEGLIYFARARKDHIKNIKNSCYRKIQNQEKINNCSINNSFIKLSFVLNLKQFVKYHIFKIKFNYVRNK